MTFYENSPDQTDTAKTAAGTLSVGAASASLLVANPSRIEFTVCNTHATQRLYLSLGSASAVVDNGITILAGGSYTTKSYTGAVQVIASGAATVASYVEI